MINLIGNIIGINPISFEEDPELTLGPTVTFASLESGAQEGSNQLIGPILYYENGKTHFVYQDPVYGRKYILTHDNRYGVSRPVGFGIVPSQTTDPHHRPAIIADNNRLYIAVEKDHNTVPISIFKSRTDNDDFIFQITASTIGATPTYPNLAKRNGIFINFGQLNDTDAGFNKNIGSSFDGTWVNTVTIANKLANEDEHYPSSILNSQVLTDKLAFVFSGRNDDLTPAPWFRRYLVKCEITATGRTYYNWSESFSKSMLDAAGSTLTATEITNNLEYFDTESDADQAYIPVSALDNNGNFYDVGADGGVYKFIYIAAGSSTIVTKTITLPGSPTLRDAASVSGNNQMGACVGIMPINTSLVYGFFRITSGAFGKVFMYKTTDLGDTWTEIEDVFPTVNSDIETFLIPHNYGDIGNDETFVFVATGIQSPGRSPVYVRKAAFGTIQSTVSPYTDVTAFTESEYNALMARSYFIEAGKITNTGTTLNTVIDQGTQASNITTTGSPVLNSSVTPTFVTLDGVNDILPLSITGLDNQTEGTIFIVAKAATGVARNFLTATNNASATVFMALGKSADDNTRLTRANTVVDIDIQGKDAVTNDWHIFAFTFQNGSNSNVLQWLDGKLQLRDLVTETAGISEGQLFDYPGTLTHISVGALVRSAITYYGFDFKHLAISLTPLSFENMRKAQKYLSTKYSITLNDFHT